jgi:hypothetical protein
MPGEKSTSRNSKRRKETFSLDLLHLMKTPRDLFLMITTNLVLNLLHILSAAWVLGHVAPVSLKWAVKPTCTSVERAEFCRLMEKEG